MKNKLILYAFTACMIAVSLTACDPCKDVTCMNGGVCDEGDCVCLEEYEGSSCETRKIDKYLGSYNVVRDCGNGLDTLSCDILEDASVEKGVMFSNFRGLTDAGAPSGDVVRGTINLNSGLITIPEQTVFLVDFEATTATFDNGVYSVTYTYTDPPRPAETCSDIYTKN